MEKFRKALAAAVTALAAVLATYLATNTVDPQLLEAAIASVISAAIAGGAVYLIPNKEGGSVE